MALEFESPQPPTSKPKWLKRKAAFARNLKKVLGPSPERVAASPEVHEEREYARFIRLKVTYAVEEKERVPAYLFIPKGLTKRAPVVLCLHQHAGQFALGKSEAAGRIGNPLQATAPELARRGFVTLAPDSVGFEERLHYWNGDVNESARLSMKGRTYTAKIAWDVSRAIDFLKTVKEADTSRVGVIGHSMGAMHVLASMALEKRIKAGVASCGMHVMRNMAERGDEWPETYRLPGLAAGGDDLELLYSLIAPRPLMVVAAEKDGTVPLSDFTAAIGFLRRVWKLEGASKNLEGLVLPGKGHGLFPASKKAAYDFLKRRL